MLVLQSTAINAVRHSDVEGSRVAAYDVNEIFMLSHRLVILSGVGRSRCERPMQSKDRMLSEAGKGDAGNSHRAVVGLPA